MKQLNKTDYHRMKEELLVEVVGDKGQAVKPRALSQPSFVQQLAKNRHPNSKFSTTQPMNEQMAKYPHFARKTRFGPSRMRPQTSKMPCKGYHTFEKVGRVRMGPKPDEFVERNDYNPRFSAVSSNLHTGSVKMTTQVDRTKMPQGRP